MADNKPIQSIVRASQIIDCFSETRLELSLAEICSQMNLNKSTVYGIVKTLEQEKYLVHDASTKKYRLGIKFVTKGLYATAALNVISIVSPYLMQLNAKYHESTNFFLYENNALHCVYALSSNSFSTMKTEVGIELPPLSSASGKAILASLPADTLDTVIASNEFIQYTPYSVNSKEALLIQLQEIRACGYAIEREEIDLGVESIAVVVRDYNGIVGTISITGPSSRLISCQKELIPDILNCAQRISNTLGYSK